MAKEEKKTNFTLNERLTLLEEAENFFKEVGTLSDNDAALYKAAAIGTVREWLLLLNSKGASLDTDEDLEKALSFVINEEFINKMEEEKWLEWEDKDFYEGWFGFCIGILNNDEDTYDNYRELQAEWYESIVPELEKLNEANEWEEK